MTFSSGGNKQGDKESAASPFQSEQLGAPAPKGRPLVMETRFEHGMLFPDGKKAILRWKQNTEMIFDLERDPGEKRNLRDSLGEDGDARMSLLRQYFRVHAGKRQNGSRF